MAPHLSPLVAQLHRITSEAERCGKCETEKSIISAVWLHVHILRARQKPIGDDWLERGFSCLGLLQLASSTLAHVLLHHTPWYVPVACLQLHTRDEQSGKLYIAHKQLDYMTRERIICKVIAHKQLDYEGCKMEGLHYAYLLERLLIPSMHATFVKTLDDRLEVFNKGYAFILLGQGGISNILKNDNMGPLS